MVRIAQNVMKATPNSESLESEDREGNSSNSYVLKNYWENWRGDSLILVTIFMAWNVFSMQHIALNWDRCDYSDNSDDFIMVRDTVKVLQKFAARSTVLISAPFF